MNITQFARSYANTFTSGVRNTASNAATTTKAAVTARVNAETADTVVRKGSAFVKSSARSFVTGALVNLVVFEAVDFGFASYREFSRRRDIDGLLDEIAEHGITEDKQQALELLRRVPPRRTFGQFIRDLPARTTRRLWRAVKFEAGWWLAIFTSPVWITTTLLYTAWTWLFVLPTYAVRNMITGRASDQAFLDRWMGTPGRWNKAILAHTLLRGVRWCAGAVEMTVYDKKSVYCNTEGEKFLDELKDKAYAEVAKIEDDRSAFYWGEALAELVSREATDPLAKSRAYAQFKTWVDKNVIPQYQPGVIGGFRTGTPLVYRDYVTA